MNQPSLAVTRYTALLAITRVSQLCANTWLAFGGQKMHLYDQLVVGVFFWRLPHWSKRVQTSWKVNAPSHQHLSDLFWRQEAIHSNFKQLIEDLPCRKWGKETFDYMVEMAGSAHASEAGAFLLSGYSLSRTPRPVRPISNPNYNFHIFSKASVWLAFDWPFKSFGFRGKGFH